MGIQTGSLFKTVLHEPRQAISITLLIQEQGTSMGIIRAKKQIMYMDGSCTAEICQNECAYFGFDKKTDWNYCSNTVVCNCGAYTDDVTTPEAVGGTKQLGNGDGDAKQADVDAGNQLQTDDSTEAEKEQEPPLE